MTKGLATEDVFLLPMGIYWTQMDKYPLINMPQDCYNWGILLIFNASITGGTLDNMSRFWLYIENTIYGNIWYTTKWGLNSPLDWRKLSTTD